MKITTIGRFTGAPVCAAVFWMAAMSAHAQQAMYEQFGGKAGVAKIVDDFVGFVAADTRINFQFAKTDLVRLKLMLNDQICAVTGGGCQYNGRDMKSRGQPSRIQAR